MSFCKYNKIYDKNARKFRKCKNNATIGLFCKKHTNLSNDLYDERINVEYLEDKITAEGNFTKEEIAILKSLRYTHKNFKFTFPIEDEDKIKQLFKKSKPRDISYTKENNMYIFDNNLTLEDRIFLSNLIEYSTIRLSKDLRKNLVRCHNQDTAKFIKHFFKLSTNEKVIIILKQKYQYYHDASVSGLISSINTLNFFDFSFDISNLDDDIRYPMWVIPFAFMVSLGYDERESLIYCMFSEEKSIKNIEKLETLERKSKSKKSKNNSKNKKIEYSDTHLIKLLINLDKKFNLDISHKLKYMNNFHNYPPKILKELLYDLLLHKRMKKIEEKSDVSQFITYTTILKDEVIDEKTFIVERDDNIKEEVITEIIENGKILKTTQYIIRPYIALDSKTLKYALDNYSVTSYEDSIGSWYVQGILINGEIEYKYKQSIISDETVESIALFREEEYYWEMIGKFKNGEYFLFTGNCGYDGFDSEDGSGGDLIVAPTWESLSKAEYLEDMFNYVNQ